MKALVIPFLIGALGGLIAAFCGVGGGVVMVPAFVLLLSEVVDQKQAVATSLAVIAPTAAVAIAKNASNGLVNWQLFWPTMIGACLFAFFAADRMAGMSNLVLTRLFGGVMIAIGAYMLFKKVG